MFRCNWSWQRTAHPPAPRAAIAWQASVPLLLERLQQYDDAALARLQLTGNRDLLLVSAAADDLPWAEGIAYASPSRAAPALWLPVLWQPSVSADLLACALQQIHGRSPLLLWHEPDALIPLDRLLPGSRPLLQQIENGWYAP